MTPLLNRDQDRARRWMRLGNERKVDVRRDKRRARLAGMLHRTPEGRIWAAVERMALYDPIAADWARRSTIERVDRAKWRDIQPVIITLPDGTRVWTSTSPIGAKWQAQLEYGIRTMFRQYLFRPGVIASPAREEAEKAGA